MQNKLTLKNFNLDRVVTIKQYIKMLDRYYIGKKTKPKLSGRESTKLSYYDCLIATDYGNNDGAYSMSKKVFNFYLNHFSKNKKRKEDLRISQVKDIYHDFIKLTLNVQGQVDKDEKYYFSLKLLEYLLGDMHVVDVDEYDVFEVMGRLTAMPKDSREIVLNKIEYNPSFVEKYRDERLTINEINNYLEILEEIFEFLLEIEVIEVNPFKDNRLPERPSKSKD